MRLTCPWAPSSAPSATTTMSGTGSGSCRGVSSIHGWAGALPPLLVPSTVLPVGHTSCLIESNSHVTMLGDFVEGRHRLQHRRWQEVELRFRGSKLMEEAVRLLHGLAVIDTGYCFDREE